MVNSLHYLQVGESRFNVPKYGLNGFRIDGFQSIDFSKTTIAGNKCKVICNSGSSNNVIRGFYLSASSDFYALSYHFC